MDRPDPTLGYSWERLAGVDSIVSPKPYIGLFDDHMRRPFQATYHHLRAADMAIYWGPNGIVDSVIDRTHNVVIPFNEKPRGSWGFVGDYVTAGNKTTVTGPDGVISYEDWPQGPCIHPTIDLPNWTEGPCGVDDYLRTAPFMPTDVDGDGVGDGNGFGIYLSGEFYLMTMAALPAAGTQWTLRTYNGYVTRDPNGEYAFTDVLNAPGGARRYPSNAAVPGLEVRIRVESPGSTTVFTPEFLERVHPVPDPYYIYPNEQPRLEFVNLPPQANIRIYSTSGILVAALTHDDPTGGGTEVWDVVTREGRDIASGVYFYHIETPEGLTKVGRMTIVNGG